jgi:formylmethanofuran dehydrogenase subunit E
MTDNEILAWYDKAYQFHKKRAPGLAIGVALVAASQARLGPVKEKLNAICESTSCLCDIIQVMTGCTLGNRYLKTYEQLGRFALTLYDRADGRGARASIDIDKISADKTPELHNFFLRTRSLEVKAGGPARLKSGEQIIREFLLVRHEIIRVEDVYLLKFGKDKMLPAVRCQKCGESFLRRADEEFCGVCSGEMRYYRPA